MTTNAHVHISFLSFLITGAYVMIWTFFWRTIAVKKAQTALGQGMAYVD